jgi:hypothetical protein
MSVSSPRDHEPPGSDVQTSGFVIPAGAGIEVVFHRGAWMPAFAGMTEFPIGPLGIHRTTFSRKVAHRISRAAFFIADVSQPC